MFKLEKHTDLYSKIQIQIVILIKIQIHFSLKF